MDPRRLWNRISYWAPAHKSGVEVDFLLQRGSESIAVAVKYGRVFTESRCKGLRAVASLPGQIRRIIVYPEGPRLKTHDGIDVFAFRDFADWAAEEKI